VFELNEYLRKQDENTSMYPLVTTSTADSMTSNIAPLIKLDGCIVLNAHNTVLGEEALLMHIVLVCYVKTARQVWKDLVISLLVYTEKNLKYYEYLTNY